VEARGTKRRDVYGVDWNESWIRNVWEMRGETEAKAKAWERRFGSGETLAEQKGARPGTAGTVPGAPGDAMDRVQLYLYTYKNDATVLRLGYAMFQCIASASVGLSIRRPFTLLTVGFLLTLIRD
jgi:hypothetical protein